MTQHLVTSYIHIALIANMYISWNVTRNAAVSEPVKETLLHLCVAVKPRGDWVEECLSLPPDCAETHHLLP